MKLYNDYKSHLEKAVALKKVIDKNDDKYQLSFYNISLLKIFDVFIYIFILIGLSFSWPIAYRICQYYHFPNFVNLFLLIFFFFILICLIEFIDKKIFKKIDCRKDFNIKIKKFWFHKDSHQIVAPSLKYSQILTQFQNEINMLSNPLLQYEVLKQYNLYIYDNYKKINELNDMHYPYKILTNLLKDSRYDDAFLQIISCDNFFLNNNDE